MQELLEVFMLSVRRFHQLVRLGAVETVEDVGLVGQILQRFPVIVVIARL